MKLLVIKSSILGSGSVSGQLAESFTSALGTAGMDVQLTVRDLAAETIPAIDADWIAAMSANAAERSPAEVARVALADRLVWELQQADMLVIAAPMYNFTIPATLKTWIDYVARAGVTFKYTDQGPVGLLHDMPVVVIGSMGGEHREGVSDHLRPYLKTVLAFLGLEDVTMIVANKLNMGEAPRAEALERATQSLTQLAAQLAGDIPARHARKLRGAAA